MHRRGVISSVAEMPGKRFGNSKIEYPGLPEKAEQAYKLGRQNQKNHQITNPDSYREKSPNCYGLVKSKLTIMELNNKAFLLHVSIALRC